MISKDKIESLHKRMIRLQIIEDDLIEKFILGSGKGGQKINKTASCVYLKHLPSGIEIKCQRARSRELNRYYARQELCEKTERNILNIKTAKVQEREKIRRQKRRRGRRSKQKMLEEKRQLSKKKQLRKTPLSE